MDTLQLCPTCASRTKPGDAWCPVCYTRLVVPEAPPAAAAAAVVQRATVADDLPADDVPVDDAPGDIASRTSRRAQRAEVERLADSMVAQLAAAESGVKLPDPLERAFDSVGLRSEAKGHRMVGLAAAFSAMLVVGLLGMWIAGLVL